MKRTNQKQEFCQRHCQGAKSFSKILVGNDKQCFSGLYRNNYLIFLERSHATISILQENWLMYKIPFKLYKIIIITLNTLRVTVDFTLSIMPDDFTCQKETP